MKTNESARAHTTGSRKELHEQPKELQTVQKLQQQQETNKPRRPKFLFITDNDVGHKLSFGLNKLTR